MGSGEHRRSARILELDARRAQSMKSKNTNSEMSKVATEQDSGTRLEHSCRKRGKRKVNFKPLEELVVKDTNHQVEKVLPLFINLSLPLVGIYVHSFER